jgi:hypothetical protein
MIDCYRIRQVRHWDDRQVQGLGSQGIVGQGQQLQRKIVSCSFIPPLLCRQDFLLFPLSFIVFFSDKKNGPDADDYDNEKCIAWQTTTKWHWRTQCDLSDKLSLSGSFVMSDRFYRLHCALFYGMKVKCDRNTSCYCRTKIPQLEFKFMQNCGEFVEISCFWLVLLMHLMPDTCVSLFHFMFVSTKQWQTSSQEGV